MSQIEMDQETVYGTHEDSHVVMSEKVQSLAGSIYQEFEKMIARYDEDVVKDLMPLLVNVLECLDISYTENQEREVELELLREDNEQLVTQYEREKQLRKTSDQKLLELEDVAEDERKELLSKIDSLESIVRMLELKTKNSHDHVVRLEEKEAELKREYTRLHERYTELFKTHVDYMERTKMLVGSTERLENSSSGRGPSRLPSLGLTHMSRSSGPLSYGFQSLEASINAEDVDQESPPNVVANLRTEMLDSSSEAAIETSDKSQLTDKPVQANKTTAISRHESPETEIPPPLVTPTSPTVEKLATSGGRSRTEREQRSGNTLYQELSFQDADALGEMDEGADITGSWVHPGEYASSVNDNFFGMGKEVENLIMENNELLATKNALNIVKDDLIVKVDELTSEQEILREEVRGLQQTRERLRQKVATLEEELKKVKEEAEAAAKAAKSDDEEDVSLAQRKRFTRVEMARVLMERNQYKERFMELQEAVRWTEMIRATKTDPSSISSGKVSVWKFFSSLFTGPADRGALVRGPHTLPHMRYSAPTNQVVPAPPLDTMRRRTLKGRHEFFDQGDTISSEKLVARRANERREQYRQVRAHVRKEDGRLHAYGWSLPGKPSAPVRQPVPVPVYCRPLQESEPGMKIWCGAGVNLSGGKTRDGGCMVGGSVFYAAEAQEVSTNTKNEVEDAVEHLDKELQENENQRVEAEQLEQHLSSLVWICTSTQKMSKVTVIDANNPADILEVFSVCQGHLLCIASVPGAKESDYTQAMNEDPIRTANGMNENDNHEVNTTSNTEQNTQKNKQETQASVEKNKNESENISEEQNNENVKKSDDVNQSVTTEPQSSENVDSETINLGKVYFVKANLEASNSQLDEKEDETEEKENKVEEDAPIEKMSSIQPTMWLGAQNGTVFVHSAVAKWSVCLHSVKLKDAALAIVHVQGRVLVALADGTVTLFRRGPDGQWDLSQYHVITLGSPQHSIRCMTAVSGKTVWCGYRNKIHVIDPVLMTVECTVDAHPRRESQVRQLAWLGEGVWVSIRLDSTLRLYHAHTYQHLQDVDIEPYVSKMLGTGKLGFSFVRITALLISSNRLWIGTGNGVIISVPLSCRRMPKIGSGLIPVIRAISLGRVLTRNAALALHHNSAVLDDKRPLSFPLISYCSARGTQKNIFLSKKTNNTLAFHRLLFRRYCCKKETEDDKMSRMNRGPAAEQLTEYKKNVQGQHVLLTGSGNPIAKKTASLTVGPNGPILLQDFVFIDEMSHFTRERIPERVVHAKGAGAFGYFEVTHDITNYCKAKVFSSIGKRTPVAVRFSSVGGESGSSDTVRDPRGFAIKFYTEDGIWDLVGNNTPIFFIKDPIFFPSFIHTQKRNPVTHLKDADMFWDFISLRPESTHQIMFLFSDRGIPDGHRHMNGYGSHTFKLVNADNDVVYCKFHYKTDQGIKNIPVDKAAELSSSDPDYSIKDLYNAIATHNYPTWTFSIQVMKPSQAKEFRWNPFDLTKVWPHDEFPLIPVGKLVLDRNPENYFADVEQIAFDPAHMVPGIEASPDKMLQGRLFSYGDTHRHRLGPNHLQLPVNCPYKAISAMNYQRDGLMTFYNQNGAPNYFPNSFSGPQECPAARPTSYHVSGDVDRYDIEDEDNFGQATIFWRRVLNDDEKTRLVNNLVNSLRNASTFIVERAVKNFTEVDTELGKRLTDGLRNVGVRINLFGKTASL